MNFEELSKTEEWKNIKQEKKLTEVWESPIQQTDMVKECIICLEPLSDELKGDICLSCAKRMGLKLKSENLEAKQQTDMVNHPPHYTFGKYEVCDVLDDWFPDNPHLWTVVKYLSRAGRKNNKVEDLEKAMWYLKRHIDKLKNI